MDVEDITVMKHGSPLHQKYGENATVIYINTKKDKTEWAEFLKKLPGVKVDSNGTITVNGRAVKSISINGRSFPVNTK